MLQEALDVWNALKGKTTQLFHELNSKVLQCERYDVTTAPNGSVIGVTQPFSKTQLFIPYSWECASAKVGDSVLVAWWGNSLSTARAWFKGSGGEKNGKVDATLSLNGYLGYRAIEREDIPSTADLNDYYLSGHYSCSQSNVAATIGNVPVGHAFILDVYSGVGDILRELRPWMYITQRFETYTGDAYIRHGETGTTTTITWGAWTQVAGRKTFSVPAGGYMTLAQDSSEHFYIVAGSGWANAARCAYMLVGYASGASRKAVVNLLPSATQVTITANDDATYRISNTSSVSVTCGVIALVGRLPTIS